MPIDVNSYNAQFSQFVQFAGGLVAARLGQDALRSIKGALESPVAGQLQAIYTDLNNEDLVEAGVPKHEATIMKRTVSDLSSDILSLLENVNATLGVEGGNVPAFEGSLDDLDGFDDIAIEIRDRTNKVHADLIQMEREGNEAIGAQRKAGANYRRLAQMTPGTFRTFACKQVS